MSTPDALSFSHLLGFLLLPSRVAAPLLLHSRSHCLHSLLPCCSGNLDVIYSANGQLTRVMLGSSVAQSFDATAVQNQKNNVDQLPLQDGATVASSEVVVGPPTTDPAGSECRNPTDQYVTVQTTLSAVKLMPPFFRFPVTWFSVTTFLPPALKSTVRDAAASARHAG